MTATLILRYVRTKH